MDSTAAPDKLQCPYPAPAIKTVFDDAAMSAVLWEAAYDAVPTPAGAPASNSTDTVTSSSSSSSSSQHHHDSGRDQAAAVRYVALAEPVFGRNHDRVLAARVRVAQGLLEKSQAVQAEAALRDVLALADHDMLTLTYHHAVALLAETVERQGRGEEAIALLETSLLGAWGGGAFMTPCLLWMFYPGSVPVTHCLLCLPLWMFSPELLSHRVFCVCSAASTGACTCFAGVVMLGLGDGV